LEKLEASRRELELAHQQLLNHSKQRERLVLIEERNRMAREIHDTLAHSLTSIIVGMEAARKLLDKDIGRARTELEKSQEQARRGLDDVRRSVKALRPRALAEQGFSDALKGLSREYGEQGVLVDVRIEDQLEVPKNYELPLFRVIQECLTNSIRHGNASRVFVTLTGGGDTLSLEVRDDGQGCKEFTEGGGMHGIRERLEALGGQVEFHPGRQDGNPGFMVKAIIKGEAV
jgi:signal transduction histidine kinase